MADTLSNITKRTLIRYISQLRDIGDIPWEVIGPVIAHVENNSQLEMLEENTPLLKNHDAEVWKKIIKRDIPTANLQLLDPNPPNDWSGLYHKLKKQRDKMVNESSKILAAKLQIGESEKKANEMNVTSGLIRTKKKTWGACPASVNRPSVRTPGQKMLSKARVEASKARTIEKKSIKPLPQRNEIPNRMENEKSRRLQTVAPHASSNRITKPVSTKGTLSSASAAAWQRKMSVMNGEKPSTAPPQRPPAQMSLKGASLATQMSKGPKRPQVT